MSYTQQDLIDLKAFMFNGITYQPALLLMPKEDEITEDDDTLPEVGLVLRDGTYTVICCEHTATQIECYAMGIMGQMQHVFIQFKDLQHAN